MIYQTTDSNERNDSKLLMPDARMQVQYQRTREMTLDDLLLENRIVFLIGEISYRLAAEVIMKLLYLDNLKRGVEPGSARSRIDTHTGQIIVLTVKFLS